MSGRLASLRGGWVAPLLLLLLVGLAWCFANGKWPPSSWQYPTAYTDLRESDVLGMLGMFRAAERGYYVPLTRKTVPDLGAPEGADWSRMPTVEELFYFIPGMLAKSAGVFAALNLKLLVGHLLAALCFFLVARALQTSVLWAFVGGLAFGLSPFLFSESPHHSIVMYAWHVPLFLLVWEWQRRDKLRAGSARFWIAMAVAFVTGLQNVYYTAIFCQIVVLVAMLRVWQIRKPTPLLQAALLLVSCGSAFVLMMADSIIARVQGGGLWQTPPIDRHYKWMEIYGLKLTDLLIPPPAHQFESFRYFHRIYQEMSILQNEGAYLGILGLLALLLLVGVSIHRVLHKGSQTVPVEAWIVLWLVLVFTIGGLNSLAGVFGFTLFRAGYRAVIVVAAVVLLFAGRFLSEKFPEGTSRSFLWGLAACFLILWDQVPLPPTVSQATTIRTFVESDRDLAQKLEEKLPSGSMVLQLPLMDFPESPAPGLTPYEHMRPYLFSNSLRFSFGALKGSPQWQWQQKLSELGPEEAFDFIREKGFAAVYVNRKGFPDGGKSLLNFFQEKSGGLLMESAAGDLAVVILEPNGVKQ